MKYPTKTLNIVKFGVEIQQKVQCSKNRKEMANGTKVGKNRRKLANGKGVIKSVINNKNRKRFIGGNPKH